MSRLPATIVLAAATTGCVFIADDATLTVHNHSSYVLTEVHLAAVNDPTWGPNLLPGVLYPGEDLVIDDIRCDHYDVLVVDNLGVDCMLADLHLCFNDESWVIDDLTLATCAFRR
jgi:hypothetical protein